MGITAANNRDILAFQIKEVLFPKDYELLPNSHEAWDWEMAFLELKALEKADLINRSAFFAKVEGDETLHYRMCNSIDSSVHKNKSIFTRAFFLANQFSTGYATHSLFPYRGKFHPQMVKGLLNILNIQPGQLVLDPMAGSFTTCVEAKIMGINSIGIDLSPFCVLMGEAKSFATSMKIGSLDRLESMVPQILKLFEKETDLNNGLRGLLAENANDVVEAEGFFDLAMLAFLDSVGYARRRKRKLPIDLFPEVFTRYLLTVRSFTNFLQNNPPNNRFGDAQISAGSVLDLKLKDNSADCILTSPPYSFAIDYVDNDAPQLQILSVDIEELKHDMIGLRGKDREARVQNYLEDMSVAFKEMARVLKPQKYCIIIIGSNSIQTRGIKLDEGFIMLANEANLELERDMVKPIKGIQNTLHEEHVMFFRKKE